MSPAVPPSTAPAAPEASHWQGKKGMSLGRNEPEPHQGHLQQHHGAWAALGAGEHNLHPETTPVLSPVLLPKGGRTLGSSSLHTGNQHSMLLSVDCWLTPPTPPCSAFSNTQHPYRSSQQSCCATTERFISCINNYNAPLNDRAGTCCSNPHDCSHTIALI